MASEIPTNYQLLHTQIANFDSLLENMISLEKKRGTSSRVNIQEVLEFKNIIKDRHDTTPDAITLDARFDYGTSQIAIATPDQHINLEMIYDITRFELEGLNCLGKKSLQQLREESPVVVYFFGTGSRAWGHKEMQLISPHGDCSIIDPNTFIEKKWILNDPIKNNVTHSSPLTGAIQKVITTYIKRNSTCNLLVHHFGQKMDLNMYYSYITMPKGYISTKEQIEQGVYIPPTQRANIDSLLEMEKNNHRGKRGLFSDLYGYEHEGDKRAYYVFVDGEMYGFNNLRGIPGYIANIQRSKPGKPILVHNPGSPLDFDFIEKLKLIDFPSF